MWTSDRGSETDLYAIGVGAITISNQFLKELHLLVISMIRTISRNEKQVVRTFFLYSSFFRVTDFKTSTTWVERESAMFT